MTPLISNWKLRRARFIGKWGAELHRLRIPLTNRVLLPLNVGALEKSLTELHDVFTRHGICFWLRDGTALGVVRGGRILASYDDVDIGIWADDLPALEGALTELEGLGFVVYEKYDFMVSLLTRGETIEIVVSKSWSPDDAYHNFVDTFFEDLRGVEYLGRTFNVPGRSEDYLEFCYGPDWRVPKSFSWWSSSSFPPQRKARRVPEGLHGSIGQEVMETGIMPRDMIKSSETSGPIQKAGRHSVAGSPLISMRPSHLYPLPVGFERLRPASVPLR